MVVGIQCQDYEACHVWGDPHLIMFPMYETQKDIRSVYWCKTPGRMVVLKNKFIEVAINVTPHPFYNENVNQTLNISFHIHFFFLYFIV